MGNRMRIAQSEQEIRSHGLLIDGQDVLAAEGKTTEDINPFTSEPMAWIAAGSPADVVLAIDAAERAQRIWQNTDPLEKQRVLFEAANILESRKDYFTTLMAREVGGTAKWARHNVELGAHLFRQAASLTLGSIGETFGGKEDVLNMTLREPAGIVAAISPWNAPIVLGVRAIAVPLALGNTVVLKPSEDAPISAGLALADLLIDAGLPAGVLNVVTNARQDAAEVMNALISDPRIRRVNFTGSTNVGREIGTLSASNLKPALLELGGKNALLLLDDADLEYAVQAATFSAFFNAGQICMSADRIVVPEAKKQDFLDKFSARVAQLTYGDPTDPTNDIGPLISERAAEREAALVKDAEEKGATVVLGGGGVQGKATYPPTIITDVTPEHRVFQEEIFGPLTVVHGYSSLDEALELINSSVYGLTAGIITENTGRGWAVAKKIKTGVVHVGDQTIGHDPAAAFGGINDSGYGKFGGREEIDFFSETRWITLQNSRAKYPI